MGEIQNILVRYNGSSHEIAYPELDMDQPLYENGLKRVVERYLNLQDGILRDYVMDTYPSTIVLRPEA